MEDLLFLTQRCPYPPNKGDKIATWNILKYLRKRFRIHLGAFVDDPDDWQYEGLVRESFASVRLLALSRTRGLSRSSAGLMSGEALSVAYYRDAELQQWVDARLRAGVRRAFVFSSAMARFLMDARQCVRMMHFADIDSDKWRQYSATSRWPLSWVYAREARRLLQWERAVAARFEHSFFVSDAEAADFRRMAPESAARVGVLSNGVDSDYFSPERSYDNPFPDDASRVVFTGAMDYRPNADAVIWFAREVMPILASVHGEFRFCIVGSRPSQDVLDLASDPRVQVTGRVEDVRPYMAHARVLVAPLRIARGIQNKVLEAMAMAKTVVCSPQALEGIEAKPGQDLLLAAEPEAFAQRCADVLQGRVELGSQARRCMVARYDWNARLSVLDSLFAEGVAQEKALT
ncbi:MAG: TIGR03087 family PEP-CTERM/XrtA system glycosyltransferase [Azoarcus sp.]|nr:TIGR03087 family PEP-CTERM/XrtA system glycosyltransferase [Azoarcus sp.]